MKTVLHIIGIGFDSLERLTLKSYRLLSKAKVIFVLSVTQEAVVDMIHEGFPCVELHLKNDEIDGVSIGELILAYQRDQEGDLGQEAVLALSGYPLCEGRLITNLNKVLSKSLNINTSFLRQENPLLRLSEIMTELRSDWGCPWDKEQTHDTLKKYLVEETYEVIDAIESKNMNNFCEELGDLLLQIVFHSKIAEELGFFNLSDVISGISNKLVHRHPHVFGSIVVNSSKEVINNWDTIKRAEKAAANETDDAKEEEYFHIPNVFPALLLAEKTQKKASEVGFDWDNYEGALAKIYEELIELQDEIGNRRRLGEEMGDLLFSIVNLSRFLEINSEEALRQATKKFQERFNKMVKKIGFEKIEKGEMSLEQMDFYWGEIKKQENNST